MHNAFIQKILAFLVNPPVFNTENDRTKEMGFSSISLENDQKEIVTKISQILVEHVDISIVAMKGYIWRAIKNWQTNNKRSVSELSRSTYRDRLNSVDEILDNVGSLLQRTYPDNEMAIKIEEGISKSYKYYQDMYAKR